MGLNPFPDQNEPLWIRTLGLMAEKRVIPVIGPELLQARVREAPFPWANSAELRATHGRWGLEADEWLVPWESLLASALAQRLVEGQIISPQRAERELLWPHAGEKQLRLSTVVGRAIRAGESMKRLRGFVADVAQHLHNEPRLRCSPLLLKLARITDFNFFVTTGGDTLFEKALVEAGRGEPATLAFDRKSPDSAKCDAPGSGKPVVYHLFGLPSSYKEFALSDEDVLEWMRALLSVDTKPPNLLDTLHGHELLFLGCSFPDWLSRFFLRLTKGGRLADYVEDRTPERTLAESALRKDAVLRDFLDSYSKGFSLFDNDVEVFVDRLEAQWRQRRLALESVSIAPESTGGDNRPLVFLSHANQAQDVAMAGRIYDALTQHAVPVFFDKVELEKQPGTPWDSCLKKGIVRCAFFVAVISRNALSGEPGRYLHLEWQLANERWFGSLRKRPFIVPVVLDDTKASEPEFDSLEGFREAQWTPLSDVTAIEEFAVRVKQLVRDLQTGASD